MLFSSPILDMASASNNHERGQDPGGYSLISAVYVFAAPKGMVYGPFWLSENTLPILVWNRVCIVFKEPAGAYMYECIYRFQF